MWDMLAQTVMQYFSIPQPTENLTWGYTKNAEKAS